ncbi:MAG: T9SS type A sorting domain-containing protein, partial [Calditrichaeota bacterium]|nr:T9SS type A sorting domain-containing protein [Calditrichota bacterium]
SDIGAFYLHQELSAPKSDNDIEAALSGKSIQIYPNPFNLSAVISFSLPEPGNVEVSVFDLSGREVSTRTQHFVAGQHKAFWNAVGYPAGLYLIQAKFGNEVRSQMALHLK